MSLGSKSGYYDGRKIFLGHIFSPINVAGFRAIVKLFVSEVSKPCGS